MNKRKNNRHSVDGPQKVSRLQLVREGKVEDAIRLPELGQRYVDVNSIVPDPRNERKTLRDMEEMIASVKAAGIVEPPTVAPLDNGKYLLTTGERRWRAAKEAGFKRIHVIVYGREKEEDRRLKSLVSNIQRSNLGPVELAQALQSLKDNRPEIRSNRDLAQLLGKSENWVGHMLKILSLPQQLQSQISQAKRPIPYDVAQQIARLPDEKAQAALINEALRGASVRSIREQARQLKGKEKKGQSQVWKIKSSQATVTIRFRKERSTPQDRIAALEEALSREQGPNNCADW